MISQTELASYLNQLLNVQAVKDYCPNGLQVSGREQIRTIVSGVTACKALLEKAVEHKADAVLVHHGYFWKNEPLTLTGMKYERLRILFANQINLFAYHLPLDLNMQFGNNVQLAAHLGLEIKGQAEINGLPLVFYGKLPFAMPADSLCALLEERLQRKPFYIGSGIQKNIKRVAWCTGAAQNFFEIASTLDVDAYLTGEVSEFTTHIARELGVDFFACGHHATERYGVQALGQHLANKFNLNHFFIEIENPV